MDPHLRLSFLAKARAMFQDDLEIYLKGNKIDITLETQHLYQQTIGFQSSLKHLPN